MTNWQKMEKAEVLRSLGAPDDAELYGYVIYRKSTDEFYAGKRSNSMGVLAAWAKRPELAKVFKNPMQAERIVKQRRRGDEKVSILLDIGKEIALFHPED